MTTTSSTVAAKGKGGPRPGAGRPKKTEKYESEINQAERKIADRLPELLETLFALAFGGAEIVEKEFQPAGLVYVDQVRTSKGQDGDPGETTRFKKKAFPNLDPKEEVLVRKKISYTQPDRIALVYLVDRVMGKPVQKVAATDSDGNDLTDGRYALQQIESALTKLAKAGNPSQDPSSSE